MDFLAGAVLIDTSAVIALHDHRDQNHAEAIDFFSDRIQSVCWVVINCTKHESFTRIRYRADLNWALKVYNFLSQELIFQINFKDIDEEATLALLREYKDQKLSFHDALCAATMIRLGIYRIFTFDTDFIPFGFEVFPLYKGII